LEAAECREAVNRAKVDDEKRSLLARVVDVSVQWNDERALHP